MALNKAIFYYNSKDSSGNVYNDLASRITQWDTKLKEFLGPDYDILVIPVLNRETDLMFAPRFPDAPTPSKTDGKQLIKE